MLYYSNGAGSCGRLSFRSKNVLPTRHLLTAVRCAVVEREHMYGGDMRKAFRSEAVIPIGRPVWLIMAMTSALTNSRIA